MTEKIAFEVRPKKGKKMQKVIFLKSIFWPLGPLGGQKKLYHIKFKSKISYLGKGPKKKMQKYGLWPKWGGGSPETKPLLQKLKSFILSVCPLSCPIRGEIIDSSVLV